MDNEAKEIESQEKLKQLCDYVIQVNTEIFDQMQFEGSGEYENYLDPIIDRLMMISVLANDALKSTIEFGLAENANNKKWKSFRGLKVDSCVNDDLEKKMNPSSNIDWVDRYNN